MAEITASLNDAVLVGLLSDEQLLALAEQHKENPAVIKIIEGAMEEKAKRENQERIRKEFMESLPDELPEPPEGTLNIYRPYIKVFRPLTKKEKEQLLETNPKLTEEELASRTVDTGKYNWGDWEVNKPMTVTGGSTGKKEGRKLSITLLTREGYTLIPIGNFRNAQEACDHLKIDCKGDSATRVLKAKGYEYDKYDGEEFTVPA